MVSKALSADAYTTFSPRIRGVAEVALRVTDLEAMQRFYEDVLGFRFRSGGPERGIVFLTITELLSPLGADGHPQLLVLIDPMIQDRPHGPFYDQQPVGSPHRSSFDHMAFEIDRDDFDAHKRRIEALGIRVWTADYHGGALFFEDPEGNTIELICSRI